MSLSGKKKAVAEVAEVAEKMALVALAHRHVTEMERSGPFSLPAKIESRSAPGVAKGTVTRGAVLRSLMEQMELRAAVVPGKRPTYIVCPDCPGDSPKKFVKVHPSGALPKKCAVHRAPPGKVAITCTVCGEGAVRRRSVATTGLCARCQRRKTVRDFRKRRRAQDPEAQRERDRKRREQPGYRDMKRRSDRESAKLHPGPRRRARARWTEKNRDIVREKNRELMRKKRRAAKQARKGGS